MKNDVNLKKILRCTSLKILNVPNLSIKNFLYLKIYLRQ